MDSHEMLSNALIENEKLREMIAEKDRTIETLRSQVQFDNSKLAELIAEKDAEIARLQKRGDDYKQMWLHSSSGWTRSFKRNNDLVKEISILRKDADRYGKLRRMLAVSTPEQFDKNIDDAKENSVKVEIYDPNYVSRLELAKLLVHPLIEAANKDAERYRKLKAQFSYSRAYNPINGKWFILRAAFRATSNDTLDSVADALPEVQS